MDLADFLKPEHLIALRMREDERFKFSNEQIGAAIGMTGARASQLYKEAVELRAALKREAADPDSVLGLGLAVEIAQKIRGQGIYKAADLATAGTGFLKGIGLRDAQVHFIRQALGRRRLDLAETCAECGHSLEPVPRARRSA